MASSGIALNHWQETVKHIHWPTLAALVVATVTAAYVIGRSTGQAEEALSCLAERLDRSYVTPVPLK